MEIKLEDFTVAELIEVLSKLKQDKIMKTTSMDMAPDSFLDIREDDECYYIGGV